MDSTSHKARDRITVFVKGDATIKNLMTHVAGFAGCLNIAGGWLTTGKLWLGEVPSLSCSSLDGLGWSLAWLQKARALHVSGC
jgi:hypothetical protein